jgi:hypothetical protein
MDLPAIMTWKKENSALDNTTIRELQTWYHIPEMEQLLTYRARMYIYPRGDNRPDPRPRLVQQL